MDLREMADQCSPRNSPVIPAVVSNMTAPHTSGTAVRASASVGSLSLAEITTPADHDSDPNRTASRPIRLVFFVDTSAPVRIATPTTPKAKPSALIRLIFCCPLNQA